MRGPLAQLLHPIDPGETVGQFLRLTGVVEWGEGVAEGLADTRLEVTITRARGDDPRGESDPRHVRFTPMGARWIGAGLHEALA